MNQLSPPSGTFSDAENTIARLARRHRKFPVEDVTLTSLYILIVKALTEVLNQVLRPYDLNRVSYSTLIMVYGSESNAVNPSMLCEVTGESRTNMTRITDDLEARGFIERSPSTGDRRRVDLALTEKGEALLEEVEPVIWKKLETMYDVFGTSEKEALRGLLKRQLAAVEALR